MFSVHRLRETCSQEDDGETTVKEDIYSFTTCIFNKWWTGNFNRSKHI